MKVIAYAYMADIHCPGCTRSALQSGSNLHIDNQHLCAVPVKHTSMDEFGIPLNAFDKEDNRIRAVFATDTLDVTHCCDCGGEL